MAADMPTTYAPLIAPLPPVPTEEVFTEPQWKTFLSLADTVIPSIRDRDAVTHRRQKGVSKEQLESAISTLQSSIGGPNAAELAVRYLEEDASSNPKFKDALQTMFARNVHNEGKKGLLLILSALKYEYPS